MIKRVGLNLALAVTFSFALVSVALASPARTVSQANGNPGILPPASTAYGKTYGTWSAAWWQWVFLQPASTNPLTDPTGAECNTGQSGPVFFLVGTTGPLSGQPITRDCTVAPGKALFFPLVNAFDVHTPGDGLDTPELVWQDLHSGANSFSVSSLFATIDEVPVNNLTPPSSPYRACAGPVAGCAPSFTFTFPADNFFDLPAGDYAPAVADGYYLMLAPLPPGQHTIRFGGTGYLGGPFSQDITYHLTVR